MKSLWIKILLPVVIIGLGVVVMSIIKNSAHEGEEKKAIDKRPIVSVTAISAINYPVSISSFGEIKPIEETAIAAQVSGEVVSWNANFVAGGVVKRGSVLFSVEKDAYEAAVLQAEAQVSLANATLIEEKARQNVAKREAKSLDKSKVSDLYLRIPQVLSAEAQVKSAEARLRIAQRDLENCDITAPYDALILSRKIGKGQYVNAGTTVAIINNVESAEVIFPIAGFDTRFLPNTLNNNSATIYTRDFEAFSREGAIKRDLGIVDQNTRMSHLVVEISDPYSLNTNQPKMKFGSYVEVEFKGKVLENVFKLPQSLITNKTVWTLDLDDKMVPNKVEIIREEGEFFFVSSGLHQDDRVVTTLPEYPQKGMEVNVLEPSADVASSKS